MWNACPEDGSSASVMGFRAQIYGGEVMEVPLFLSSILFSEFTIKKPSSELGVPAF